MRFPLTQANLHAIEPRHEAPAEQPKLHVREFLQSLECIGPVGRKILEKERLYLDQRNQVRLRDVTTPSPASDDIVFWEGNLRRLQEQHGRTRTLERVKGSVLAKMNALAIEGAHILEHDELYIAGSNDIRLRENRAHVDLDSVGYWERKYTHFEEQLFHIRQKTRGRPVAAAAACPREESPCETLCLSRCRPVVAAATSQREESLCATQSLSRCSSPRHQDFVNHDNYARITAWTLAQSSDLAIPESSSKLASTANYLELLRPSTPPDSVADLSECDDNLERLKGWVYDFMSHLHEVGPEGRRILDQDELRIDGTTSMTYRLGEHFIKRGHKLIYRGSPNASPDLRDHAYWEAKLDFFRREALRIQEISFAKSEIFHAMRRLQRYGLAGQEILDSDELYIAGHIDVRCRQEKTHDFELQDPDYWHNKNEHFQACHSRLALMAPPTRQTSPMREASPLGLMERKRSFVEEAEILTTADSGNKRRRFSHRGLSPQQNDRSPIGHSSHGSTAAKDIEPTQGLIPNRPNSLSEAAATGFPEPFKSYGRGKRHRAPRRVNAPSSQAVEAPPLPSPLPMARTRRGRVPLVQPQRRRSSRRVNRNTVEGNGKGQSLLKESQSRRQTGVREGKRQRSSRL